MPDCPARTGRSALLVFAKSPEAGRVKTRLTPPLTPEEAAALADAFLLDALDAYVAPGAFDEEVAVRLYLDGHAGALDLPVGLSVHAQRGDGLGARMRRAFVETFAAGYERIAVVGTDHPTLPVPFVGLAFEALAEPLTAVLGPSDDGGYYLLGLNELYPSLFDMAYGHGGVFDETLRRASARARHVTVLPPWYDVDDAASLRRLVADWQRGAALPARTAASLEALLDAHGQRLSFSGPPSSP